MTKPRTKRLLLAAVAIVGPGAAAVTSACSSSMHATGFVGDIAYDGGYENETGRFANDATVGDAAAEADAEPLVEDAAADANDAADGGS
ncbi:hypothetical protein BH11MYX4_BH11MYX4_22750 [soil metagenome]